MHTQPDDADPRFFESDFLSIAPEGRVRMLHDACIALRSGDKACRACRDACPSASIEFSSDVFSVKADCMGCGQCAAACSSGALAVKGFEKIEALARTNTVRIECSKVPASVSGPHALRVPCLGGLSPSQWLSLVKTAGERRLILVDRGWCAHCTAAKASLPDHPAQRSLAKAQAILDGVGWATSRQPHIEREPLAVSLMPATIPTERPSSPGRRAFFRRIGQEAERAVGTAHTAVDVSPRTLRQRAMPLPERERLLSTARRLAESSGTAMPAAPYVALQVSGACGHHQLCARLCPTGALALYERDGAAGLEFDAELCTNCGLCARNCPEQAMRIVPAAHAPVPGIAQRLTAFGERLCARCRNPFSSPGGNIECPACLRSVQLGKALFGTRIASKPASAALSSGGIHHE